MSKKSNTRSILTNIGIGALGVLGGLLIGKAINDSSNNEKKEALVNIDPTEYTKNIEDYDNVENLMICPITNCLMR